MGRTVLAGSAFCLPAGWKPALRDGWEACVTKPVPASLQCLRPTQSYRSLHIAISAHAFTISARGSMISPRRDPILPISSSMSPIAECISSISSRILPSSKSILHIGGSILPIPSAILAIGDAILPIPARIRPIGEAILPIPARILPIASGILPIVALILPIATGIMAIAVLIRPIRGQSCSGIGYLRCGSALRTVLFGLALVYLGILEIIILVTIRHATCSLIVSRGQLARAIDRNVPPFRNT